MKDRPFTIPFVLRGQEPAEGESSRFYRMTHKQERYDSHEKKISGLKEITQALRSGDDHDDVYAFSQSRIDDIGRRPFLYWVGEETLLLFSEYDSLDSIVDLNQGLSTSNDERLVKKWWEIPKDILGTEYVRFQKSGTDAEYYDYPQDYVAWEGHRDELEESGANFRNEEKYFKEGVTFRRFGSYFVGRKHYNDGVFSADAIFTTSDVLSDEILIAHYNSTLYRYLANGLNPGLHFEAGDASRLPIKTSFNHYDGLESLSSLAIRKKESISSLAEMSSDYDETKIRDCLSKTSRDLIRFEEVLQAQVDVAHGIIDQILFDEYDISPETQEQMYGNLPKNTSEYPVDRNIRVEYSESLNKYLEVAHLNDERIDAAVETLQSLDDATLREAAEETELSPLTVAQLRYDFDLYTDDERKKAAGRVVSLIVGSLFGRWDPDSNIPILDEEILAFDHSTTSITNLFYKTLNQLFQDSEQAERALESALGDQPVNWLRERFFRYHHVNEYKPRGERSPIYWQLESPNGGFSCFIYYHDIDVNTLPKLRGQYLDPRIEELENELETLNAQTSGDNPDKDLLKRKEEVQNDLDDIKDFRDTIDEMIDDGVTVDVEKGIWENIKEWDQYEVLETGLPKLKSSYSR
jgi:ADP-ribose pyrophosphatase YjhB (NUDIX family)